MLELIVMRKKKSYDFKADPKKPSSFENNWKNNMQDRIQIWNSMCQLAEFPVQTVANYCFGDMASNGPTECGDTVKEGYFKVKCFVEKRGFHGEIHGICETTDLDGQKIDRNSMQTVNGFQTGRWLIHDCWSDKLQRDTNQAWSAGCFIMTSANLHAFNEILHAYDIKPGDIIEGELIEED